MALIACPDCGKSVSDSAAACVHCGRRLDQPTAGSKSQEPLISSIAGSGPPIDDLPSQSPAAATLPLFPVATHKFIVLSICSFSIYELYWCYQNWKRLKTASSQNLSPFWRAFFAPLWGFSLFRRIRATALANGVIVGWSAGALGTFYLILFGLWRLPDPWWLISFASFIPMVPVQQAAQRVNDLYSFSP